MHCRQTTFLLAMLYSNPQPVTLSSFLDSSFSTTRGSILYRGAAGWAVLGPGTSGYFLQTQGAGANPAWAALAGGGNLSTTGTTTAGYLPKFGSPTTGITNSQCDDGVTKANTFTCAGTGGINVPNGSISAGSVSSPPPTSWLTGGGGIASVADGTCTVGSIPAGVSGLCDKSGLPYWASQVSGNNYQALASNTTTNTSYYLKATSTAGVGTYGAIVTTDLPASIRYGVCDFGIGDASGSAITSAQLGPQKGACFVPAAATVLEVDVYADGGTSNIIVGVDHAGTVANLVSAALATAAGGARACSNTGGTTGLDGATTCSATLQNTSIAAGDYINAVSGTVGGTAKWFTVHVTYEY